KFFDDKFVTAFIDKEARENTKLQELWQNRLNNPRPLAAAANQLAKDFQKTYSRMPDPNVTEDRAMVAAAIRGASAPAQTEPPPNYARLSNADMRDEMRKLGIQPNLQKRGNQKAHKNNTASEKKNWPPLVGLGGSGRKKGGGPKKTKAENGT